MTNLLIEQRLATFERICRGLSHEANNRLYAVIGQVEMAELYLWQVMVVLRYLERLSRRLERADGAAGILLPAETLDKMLRRLPRMTQRRRIEGLRKVRRNVQRLSEMLQHLHMFAYSYELPAATVDLNAAVRAALELLGLGYYRAREHPPRVLLDLCGCPIAVACSSGLVIGLVIDLIGDVRSDTIRVATRQEDGVAVLQIAVDDGCPSVGQLVAAALDLCGGALAVERSATGQIITVRLPLADGRQPLRSGSC